MEVGRYPYGNGFLGLVSFYHSVQQRMDVQWSASAVGEKFWRPIPRTPCVPNPALGDYGGGMIWPYRLPVEDGGRLYISPGRRSIKTWGATTSTSATVRQSSAGRCAVWRS